MTYADRAAIAVNTSFISRVRVAVMTAAVLDGLKPKGTDEADFYYKKRVLFSIDVIYTNPEQYLNAFVWALVWNSSLVPGMVDIVAAAADLTDNGDAEIQQAVNAVFQFMATAP